MSFKPKVTVYMPCRNYGKYLQQAAQSVADQIYLPWELLLINDGSTDETAQIAEHFRKAHPDRVRIVTHPQPRGLQASANEAIDLARGEYIIRLDPDDYFDESALLVMANYLDRHPDIALVYPNYIYIDEEGRHLGMEHRKKIGKEVNVMDLPAHGACTMIRKRILKTIGGYNESYKAQDGHEVWLKILHRYKIGNVSTPLFYYRQHASSVSRKEDLILSSRRRIKHDMAKKRPGAVKPVIAAIIPAKNTYKEHPNIALQQIAGKPLIDYTLEAGQKAGLFDALFVSTDDPRVVRHCRSFKNVMAALRPQNLSAPGVGLQTVVADGVHRLEEDHQIFPDIVVLLSIHCPLRRPEHIREAVHTLQLYNLDTVISVFDSYDLLFKHGADGMEVINKGMMNRLRLEREALYIDNGAICASWRDHVKEESFYGRKIGHITMALKDSFQMRSAIEGQIVKDILVRRQRGRNVVEPEMAASGGK